MFSRRKLFQMIGLGAAVAATAQIATLPAAARSSPWLEEVTDYGERLQIDSLIEAQSEINRRRSEMIALSPMSERHKQTIVELLKH